MSYLQNLLSQIVALLRDFIDTVKNLNSEVITIRKQLNDISKELYNIKHRL